MNQVVPGVHEIKKGVNAFVVDGDDGVVLIDTGLPKRHEAIVAGLGSIGRTINDIVAIVLTHSHVDHAGGAAALARESRAPVIASELDGPAISGAASVPPPPILDFPIIRGITAVLPKAEGVRVDHLITDGEVPVTSDLRAIATPGHTAGHISLLLDRSGGVLFVGDAAVSSKKGEVNRGFFNRKTDTFDASLSLLAAESFQVACFGHSDAITADAADAFKRFAVKL